MTSILRQQFAQEHQNSVSLYLKVFGWFFFLREVVKNNYSLEFIRHNDGKQSVTSENTNTITFKDENFENKAKDKSILIIFK